MAHHTSPDETSAPRPGRPGDADVVLDRGQLRALCERALLDAGASAAQAAVLADATTEAELLGRRAVGLTHLLDYIDGFRTGRITSAAEPVVERRTPAWWGVDCRGGLAQHGFDLVLDRLHSSAGEQGLAVAALRETFTAGELDHYVRRLNRHGLMAIACANSPALMTVAEARGPLLGSNPMAYGVPLADGRRLAVDQASSATAWVSLRESAARGEDIPPTWAVDGDGAPTTSPTAALAGALLPFGGYKGGNVALLVELLATLAGGRFSTDAAPFDRGSASPAVGVLVVAVATETLNPGYRARLEAQLERWQAEHGANTGVWTGLRDAETCSVPRGLHDRLRGSA